VERERTMSRFRSLRVHDEKDEQFNIYIYIVRRFHNDFVLIVSEIESERDERRDEQNRKNTIYVLNRHRNVFFFRLYHLNVGGESEKSISLIQSTNPPPLYTIYIHNCEERYVESACAHKNLPCTSDAR
jgi:hypothetical protein